MNVSAWPLGFTQPILHIVISLALSTQRVQTDNNERLRLLSSPPGPPSSPSSQHTMVDFLIPQPPLAQLKYRVSSARCVRAIAAFISFIIFSPLDPLSESRRVASRRVGLVKQCNQTRVHLAWFKSGRKVECGGGVRRLILERTKASHTRIMEAAT